MRKRDDIQNLWGLFILDNFNNRRFLTLTHHTLAVRDSLRPVFILPAEKRCQGHNDGHDPDGGDQHPDGGRVPRVDVVGVSHGPIPAQQSTIKYGNREIKSFRY